MLTRDPGSRLRRDARRRRLLLLTVAVITLSLVAAGAATAAVWNRLTRVPGDCSPAIASNVPSRFTIPPDVGLDAADYAMPAFEELRIPSREPGIEVSAFWVPAAGADAPAVVVVHGHTGCKRDMGVLLAAGMLHRNGFSVVLVDLRDHGDSTLEDGRYAGGTEEYREVLGAWDWLRTAQGLAADRIGLLGLSLGAATVLIAAGEEPGVAAVWADSSYADIRVAIRAELERNGYPTVLEAAGVGIARLLSGDDLASRSPLDAVRRLGGRDLLVTHGTEDSRLSVTYAYDLIETARAAGARVVPWIVEGVEHTQALTELPDEYERRLAMFFGPALGEG